MQRHLHSHILDGGQSEARQSKNVLSFQLPGRRHLARSWHSTSKAAARVDTFRGCIVAGCRRPEMQWRISGGEARERKRGILSRKEEKNKLTTSLVSDGRAGGAEPP